MATKRTTTQGPEQSGPNLESQAQGEPVYYAGPDGDVLCDIHKMLLEQGKNLEDAADDAAEILEIFRENEVAYLEGNKFSALYAIELAAELAMPAPTWATNALIGAVTQWRTAEVRTLDEALGISRPRNWNQAAAKREAESIFHVFNAVIELQSKGLPMDQELWDQVEADTGTGSATAKRWWYRHARKA